MKAVFLRVLAADDKRAALSLAVSKSPKGKAQFNLNPEVFRRLPRSPFAYWAGPSLIRSFDSAPPLATQGREAWVGLQTNFDFRWLRLWWEPQRKSGLNSYGWPPFAKGGSFSPYYAPIPLAVEWADSGHQLRNWKLDQLRLGSITANNSKCWNESHYFRPGLTWPSRTNGLSVRALPRGGIFGHKGPGVFEASDDPTALLALAAITNSAPFGALVSLQLARTELAQSFEVGLIQQTPVPNLEPADREALSDLAGRAWSLKRGLDTRTETSHAFERPALLQVPGSALTERASEWIARLATAQAVLANIQGEIDDRCYALYGISEEDRVSIERGFGAPAGGGKLSDDEDPEDADPGVDASPMVASLLSWSLGVGFGRFDVRLATGEREPPPEPEPFDPLPPCSPGMLTGDDGLPLDEPPLGYPIGFPTDGVLVDDLGHPRDLVAAARRVFDFVFPDYPDGRWQEAAELVGARKNDMRDWFSRTFFEQHHKRYSKSRRKAPLYWQLATPSASYSVWLYCHRLTRDTFFKVLNDYVTPKLQHEQSKLTTLVQAGGPNPSASQGKAIAAQDSFVDELRAFREEVERVAPLFHPDLDDGIVLVKAPLWRLVPQHKAWQKELRKKWKELQEGKYDWAHLAMHVWPERVVPKCAEDRSLAIAHDLEAVFWAEDEDGKWHPREVDPDTVAALVEERTSAAVKDALQKLLDAPVPKGASRGRKRRKK